MQKKIIDYENRKKKKINFKQKSLFIFIFLILMYLFATSVVFAETQLDIDNINVVFDKENYSIMEDTSLKIGFTIENNNNAQAKLLVFADCEDEDDELECDYSKQFTMPANSTTASSFYIRALEESYSTLRIYVKLLNATNQPTESFHTYIEITEDEEDGDFQVDLYDYDLCIGKTNKIYLEVINDYQDDLYYIYLDSQRLAISSDYSNPVYLREEKDLGYYITVPKTAEQGESFPLTLRIENESITDLKKIYLYASDCPETEINFTVSGPSVISYNINKEQEKTASYILRNNSRSTKTFYISEEHTIQDIDIIITPMQFTLLPGESRSINFTFKTIKNINSGTHDIRLTFFDGINSITKKVRLYVNPNFSFQLTSITGSDPVLAIGQNLELLFVIKNNGDISDEFTITTQADNDVRIRTSVSKVTVSPRSSALVSVFISAGDRTETGYSRTYVKVNGRDSGYYGELFYNVNIQRSMPIITLELLSFPKTITIDKDMTRDFAITLKNTGTTNIIINRIQLTNIPQNIQLITESDILLAPSQTKTVTARLVIGDIPKEDISAKLRFVSNTGGVLEKPVTLSYQKEEPTITKARSKLTGYLTLRNSIFLGIIVVCLLVILLYATSTIKNKRAR